MRIAVVTATQRVITGLPPATEVVPLSDVGNMPEATRGFDALVIVSDGFDIAAAEALAAAVREDIRPYIEVRAARWDGQTPSPLSSACRGVISGFGDGGVLAAVRVLGEAA